MIRGQIWEKSLARCGTKNASRFAARGGTENALRLQDPNTLFYRIIFVVIQYCLCGRGTTFSIQHMYRSDTKVCDLRANAGEIAWPTSVSKTMSRLVIPLLYLCNTILSVCYCARKIGNLVAQYYLCAWGTTFSIRADRK